MRIKSYFAPSVQSAISIARKEFGDDVTLVTSHAAALESRHLGDYEVVFAVEESANLPAGKPAQVIKAAAVVDEPTRAIAAEPDPKPGPPAPVTFDAVLEQAIAEPLSTEENLPGKLQQVRSLLFEMGIDAAMLRALMTMIERSAGLNAHAAAEPVPAEAAVEAPEPEPQAAEAEPAAAMSGLTPAELAFYLSVSVGS